MATDPPRTFIWLGLAWLLVAACLGLIAWTLLQLDSSNVYILLVPGINAITLGIFLSLLAVVPATAGIYILVRSAVVGTRHRWVARLVKATGLITGIYVSLVFSYLAFAMFTEDRANNPD